MEQKKAMEAARHSMEIEGFTITEKHEELAKKQLNGEISEEEFLSEVRKNIQKADQQ